MKINPIKIYFSAVIILFLSFLIFIKFSNDHIECETKIFNYIDKNDFKVTKTEHVCKERFNF